MADTPHDGTGTVLRLGATQYTVTNIVIQYTDPNADAEKIDVSHLGLTTGASIMTQDKPLQGSTKDTGRTVQFDYLGKAPIADASTGTCSITIGGTAIPGFSSLPFTVNACTLTLATNDAIKGQATLRVARV
ncbi:MAG: hypothetical protein EBR82_35100 [Caulobacteraceae bacterium]|nr:hypothetical protein [Caulobacteraceae bacterium]